MRCEEAASNWQLAKSAGSRAVKLNASDIGCPRLLRRGMPRLYVECVSRNAGSSDRLQCRGIEAQRAQARAPAVHERIGVTGKSAWATASKGSLDRLTQRN